MGAKAPLLVVDDATERRDETRTRLERAFDDVDVSTERTGREGIERLADEDAQCVVSEYDLPDVDGVDLLAAVREEHGSLPFVLFTGEGDDSVAGRAIANDVTGYVSRDGEDPYETLVDRVGEILEEKADDESEEAADDDSDGESRDETARDRRNPERQLSLLLEQSPVAIIEWDLDLTVQEWNPTAEEIFGYSPDEAIGRNAAELILPEHVEPTVEELREELLDGEGRTCDVNENVTESGDVITCEWHNRVVVDEEGRPVSILSVARDITDQVRQTTRLGTLQETTRDLIRSSSREAIADIVVGAACDVLEKPTSAVYLYDDDADELSAVATGEGIQKRFPDRSVPRSCPIWEAYERGTRQTVRDGENDEAIVPAESTACFPLDEHGVLVIGSEEIEATDRQLASVLAANTIAALDRLQFETQLKGERDRFAALFENVPDPVVNVRLSDGEPAVRAVNSAFDRVFGYSNEEIAGGSLHEYIVPPEQREDARSFDRAVRGGTILELEVERTTVDGIRDFLLHVVPIEIGSERTGSFGVYTDITERKQRRKRLQVLNRVLRHDLRNGMNIITGNVELLAEHVEDPQYEQLAENIQACSEDLVSLGRKTRAIERSIDNEDRERIVVDVVDLVAARLADASDDFPHVTVETDFPERAIAKADRMIEIAIENVIENVIENALVHNTSSNPLVSVSIGATDDVVTIEVRDNGEGIPEPERKLVTEDQEITQLQHASGIGLWLVNWIVTQSGGDLYFDSDDQEGTTAVIELPRYSRDTQVGTGVEAD